jgi:transcriptional regulator with XRE-family HTH domain
MQVNREALIAIRNAGGDSQKSLAERAGVTAQTIWLIETGRSVSPRASVVRKIADALSVPVGAITVTDWQKESAS